MSHEQKLSANIPTDIRVCTIRTSAEVLALALGVEPDPNLTLTL